MRIFESRATRRNVLVVLILLCVLLLWGTVPAQGASGDVGSASGISLRLDPGARSSSLGSAYAASFNDPFSVHFNPAGLGSQTHTEGSFTRFNMLDDVDDMSLNHLTLVSPLVENRAGLGLSVTSLDFGDFQRTEVNRNRNPIQGLGGFDAGDINVSGSLGFSLTDSLKAGLSATYYRSTIAEFEASTVTGDFGLQYHIVPRSMVVGLAARNVGGGLEFVQEEDPLATVYDLGITSSWKIRDGTDELNLMGDIVYPPNSDFYVATGLEYGFYRTLFLRAGYNGAQDADDGFTLGLGVHDQRFKINYSYQPTGELGTNQRLTLSYIFGAIEAEETADEPEPKPKLRSGRDDGEPSRDGLRELLRQQRNSPYLKPPPDQGWLHAHVLGKEAYRNGNYVKARDYFLKAYRVDPARVENLLWLGAMEWYLGRTDRAVRHMKQALQIDPDNKVARENLSRMKKALEKRDS
jgi:hypothetical protein